MENTKQEDEKSKSTDDPKVAVKKKKCVSRPVIRAAAALTGIAIAVAAVLLAYAAGKFDSNPDLPEIMEGEATFRSDDGEGEVFHVMIHYKKKLIQLTSFKSPASTSPSPGRRLNSFEEGNTTDGTNTEATKIVIQDYNTQRKYFIVKENGNSTTKCIYTDLEGDMIPRHLLKHATLKSESIEGNMTHNLFQVDNDTDVDVYRAKGRHGKIYEIYFHLPNGTIHMRSKEKELNFTAYERLNCYKYWKENDTIEEAFYRSNDSKLHQEYVPSADPWIKGNLQTISSNATQFENETTSLNNDSVATHAQVISRRRRGFGWRDGFLDWWYANWCGPKQGGYTKYPKPSCNKLCYDTTSYVNQKCRDCLPPKDSLDRACMEHDRCIIHEGGGPWWCQPVGNPCKCDRPFVWKAWYNRIWGCTSLNCRWHALQVTRAFKLLSCWYPARLCFPTIRFECRCFWCTCPRVRIHRWCISFKRCAFFGSGWV